MGVKNNFENFRDWIPIRSYWSDNEAFVDWCFIGKERLTEPFFDDSIVKRFRQSFNLLFQQQTSMEFLGELNEFSKGLLPTGFIFHLSRCGSTLVSQMLAALKQNIVISEASPIDFVLRPGKNSEAQRIKWLQWIINALGQKRNAEEENFFIKFDSWNTLELNLIKHAFPEVPWIFLYRNPVEIIVSHIKQRGAQMVPGLIKEILPDLRLEKSLKLSPEEYCARVLGKICQTALEEIKNGKGLAVNYCELPEVVNSKILKHFKILHSQKDVEKMLGKTEFNAKNPHLHFSADSEKKKKESSKTAIEAAENFVNHYYRALERIRNNNQENI